MRPWPPTGPARATWSRVLPSADHTFGLPASAVLPHGGAIVVWATWDRHIQLRELLPTG